MSERHVEFEERMDRGLAGAGTAEEARLVEEHVRECAGCAEYLRASRGAVAGLKGFAFEVGLGSQAKVMAAVRAKAAAMEARRRWVKLSVLAVVLTVVGTGLDLWVGRWVAGWLGLQVGEVQHGLMALWIAPSIGLLVLFPLLPWLTAKGYGRGRTI